MTLCNECANTLRSLALAPPVRAHARVAHTHARTHMQARRGKYARTYARTHAHARTRTRTHARTHTHMHTNALAHTLTHSHTHTRGAPPSRSRAQVRAPSEEEAVLSRRRKGPV
eukprot:4519927-Pleurochrysis_carterae.AAC.1